MSIKSNIPQIIALRKSVEERMQRPLLTHSDFEQLVAEIERELREHISESTLERVWNYSTRGYDTVSLRTLNLLATYAKGCNFHTFCNMLDQSGIAESALFNVDVVLSSQLNVGDRLRIGWLPNRICEIRYLGDNRYIAEQCENSQLGVGDTFICTLFILGKPLTVSELRQAATGAEHRSYIAGERHGLTTLTPL